jgi:hypothetical protein
MTNTQLERASSMGMKSVGVSKTDSEQLLNRVWFIKAMTSINNVSGGTASGCKSIAASASGAQLSESSSCMADHLPGDRGLKVIGNGFIFSKSPTSLNLLAVGSGVEYSRGMLQEKTYMLQQSIHIAQSRCIMRDVTNYWLQTS